MTPAASTAKSSNSPGHDLAVLRDDIAGVPVIDDPVAVRRRSRDFFWYSPVLNTQLRDKSADIVVCPRDEGDVVRVAAACARHRVPLTPRGAGTGNYGQAVPLAGGVLLDLTALATVEWQRPGVVRVAAGAKMVDIDALTGPSGWELRMHPSTKRTATIGGFVAGGSGGVGSVAYGGLREPGNILAARIVTLEEQPRVIELRGDAAQKVNRAYGTRPASSPAWKCRWRQPGTGSKSSSPLRISSTRCGSASTSRSPTASSRSSSPRSPGRSRRSSPASVIIARRAAACSSR
jgi:FAD/FMN-containing dehydrogenase